MNTVPQAPPQPAPTSRQPSKGLLAPSFTLMRVRGIRIGAHWSWLLVFALISWSLARTIFPFAYPGLTSRTYLVMGAVSSLIFFVCILLHELGHAFQAIKEGMKISDITLWLFGGVARFEGMFPTAKAELRIAAAGPVVSVVLVVIFAVLTWLSALIGVPLQIRGVSDYLARINLAVVVFNLVPALPLDGGRILRSWLWNRTGNFTRSTATAARIGQGFGYVLIILGLFEFVVSSRISGLWFVVMGWFLFQAAGAERNYAMVRQAFQDQTVGKLMTPHPIVVRSDLKLDAFLELVRTERHSTYPVVDDGLLKGMISLQAASGVPADRLSGTGVAEVMGPPVVIASLSPVVDVIEILRDPPGRAAVVDGAEVVGVVAFSDVVRSLNGRQSQDGGRPSRRRRTSWKVWAAIAIVLPLFAAWYQPPLMVVSPAPAVDISQDIELDGVAVTDLNGRYLLVAVNVIQPNALRAAFSYLDPGSAVIPTTRLLPSGMSQQEYLQGQRNVFEESRMAAAAAAAEAVGLPVELEGQGAQVVDVVEGSPADGNLQAGDVIVRADGAPIRLVSDLVAITTINPAGTRFELTVLRDSETVVVEVTSASLGGFNSTNTGIGIITITKDLDVSLPFEIDFRQRNIGGPSAGLIYALMIADLLDEADVAQGRNIAASGTVQLNGRVGPVGSLDHKLRSAEGAGADVLLVPQGELIEITELGRRSRVTPLGVETLEEALGVLNGRIA